MISVSPCPLLTRIVWPVFLISLLVAVTAWGEVPPDLLTVAERSEFKSTALYAEVMDLAKRMADRSPYVHLTSFGTSQEGRSLPLLIIADPPIQSAAAVRASDKAVVFAMADIHAGEVCGKEALLILARELALGGRSPLLDDLVVLLAPIYNADGNERMSPDNRPGQKGPENGMGQRENAQGLDLNRDHVKLASPEARGLARLLTSYDPDIVVDTHTTNGSRHVYTITYDGPRQAATAPEVVSYVRDTMLPQVGKALEASSGYRSFAYGNFSPDYEHWETYPAWSRYNTQYAGIRGHLGILCEAYAYADYRDRVLGTQAFVHEILQFAAQHRQEIQQLRERANQQAAALSTPEKPVRIPIAGRSTPGPEVVRVEGWRKTDQAVPEKDSPPDTIPLTFDGLTQVTKEVVKPYAYLIPADLSPVLETLGAHGIRLEVLREDLELEVEKYRITEWQTAAEPFQGHYLATAKVQSEPTRPKIPAGTILARTDQRLGPLLVNLLEPESEDGLLTWNFFDAFRPTPAGPVDFPVWRLLTEQPVLAIRYRTARTDQSRRAPRVLSLETLYGRRAVNLAGAPAQSMKWLADGGHFVQTRENRLWKFVADTGQADIVLDPEVLAPVIAGLAGLDVSDVQGSVSPYAVLCDAAYQQGVVDVRGDLYCVKLDGSQSRRLTSTTAPEELTSFSPDGRHVAFVRDHAVWVVDVASGEPRQVTPDGSPLVRYGKADWVYFEEIYNRSWRSFHWSPDSRSIAFMEFDDRPVKEFAVVQHMTPRGVVEHERYPKSGDPIPQVRVGIVGASGGPITWVDLSNYSQDNRIVTRYGWLPGSDRIFVMVQDRAQKWLDYLVADARDGSVHRVFRERSKTWVADPEDPKYLADGSFLLCSERDGWRHVYHFQPDGTLKQQLTHGDWEVRSLKAVDPAAGWVYVQGTKDSHLAENLYRVPLAGGDPVRLTSARGSHDTTVAETGGRFVDANSDVDHPTRVVLRAADGGRIRRLDTNPVPDLRKVQLSPVEVLEIPLPDGYVIPCTMVRPRNFDAKGRYPVWLMTYGGPHAPTVSRSWSGGRGWDQLLASQGIIAFHCDPRSASGQGAQSTWTAYERLGTQETQDLEHVVDWLCQQPYVDGSRIGMSGYSYGGYLTSYVLTHSRKFAAGIAGAPVTDWRNYDAFYTERFMNTPQENPDGYDRASVVEAAQDLHGRLLLIHGAADDNVHLQNTLQLAHAFQEHDLPFELMIYPTSRHGIHGMHFQRLNLDFIRRTMLGEATPPATISHRTTSREAASP